MAALGLTSSSVDRLGDVISNWSWCQLASPRSSPPSLAGWSACSRPRLARLGPLSRGGTSGHCHRPSDSCRTRCVMRSRAREHLQGGERRYPDWAAAIGHNAEARSARTATSGRTSASSAPSAGHEPPSVRGPIVRTSSALRGQHQSLEHYGQVVGDHSAAELSKERPSLESGPACFLRLRRARPPLIARNVLRRWPACHLERLRVRLHEGLPPLSGWHLLARLGKPTGRGGL